MCRCTKLRLPCAGGRAGPHHGHSVNLARREPFNRSDRLGDGPCTSRRWTDSPQYRARTRHRLDPARVPRSRHRAQRRRAASGTQRVHHLLHAVTNAPGTGERRADLAPGHAVVGRADRRDAVRRRAPPSVRSRGWLIAVGRRPAHDIPWQCPTVVHRPPNPLSYCFVP
jgi:hypothetical protein